MSPDAPTPDAQVTAPVLLLAGRYQLLDKLGQGGMGAVFHARDTQLDRHVAVKLLPADSIHDADAVARFHREARALARLSHPGIIQAFDHGADGDRHFLVMEFVEGRSLAEVLRDQGRVAPPRAADFAYQAALALRHAHRSGLVHRDVKPSNLLLSADGRLRLLDLGLARFLQDQIGDAGLTREGAGLGTPDYCPPEQFRDAHHADPRADVYSLGCTLYQLIAGRVPFPGSSFSEKVQAHEAREPAPLEELCPDVPAGLALAVRRMMAKRPADRFASMAEVAEALMPHVAGSSASFPQIRNSATWDGSRLATMPAYPRRRRRAAWAVAAVLFVAAVIGIVGFAAGWFRPGERRLAGGGEPSPTDTGRENPPEEPPRKEEPILADDSGVLTVSREEKDGGKYRTITAALGAVGRGQTIRVLDAATYAESLSFRAPHAGVVLEATNRAVLECPPTGSQVCSLDGAAGVTVRGFRVRPGAGSANVPLVVITGHCPGAVLEDLTVEGGNGSTGVLLDQARSEDGERPIEVRRCSLAGMSLSTGLAVRGPARGEGKAAPAGGITVRGCDVSRCATGIALSGRLSRIRLCANTVGNCAATSLEVRNLAKDAGAIVLANNTLFNTKIGLLIFDEAPYEPPVKGQVELANNLLFGCSGMDVVYVQDPGNGNEKDFMKGGLVKTAWDFRDNAREKTGGLMALASVPVADDDLKLTRVELLSRNSSDPNFLRPPKDSPLASRGVGRSDPRFPKYIGAVPPEGAEAWDWDRAGRVPKGARLLTVSKDSKDGGQYRTINEALKDAKPWDTVRVLDDATYAEAVSLTNREAHAGISLEAPRHATLHLTAGMGRAVSIRDVPNVRVSGFRFIDTGGGPPRDTTRAFVVVAGKCPGVRLTGLELKPTLPVSGLVLEGVSAGEADEPVRVERCSIRCTAAFPNEGIIVVGKETAPAEGIVITDNRLLGTLRGVTLIGQVDRAFVAGNLIGNSKQAGIDLANLVSANRRVWLANNTVFGCLIGLRFSERRSDGKYEGGGEITNNLVFDAAAADVAYLTDLAEQMKVGEPATIRSAWRWRQTWRDFSGTNPELILPAGADQQLVRRHLSAFDLETEAYPRPVKGSPLAENGEGVVSPLLPRFVGALPPEGTAPWGWDRAAGEWLKKAEDKK
jgi:hypothetical protein